MKSIILIIFAAFLFVFQSGVDAHILQSENTIGSIMHIDPEDDPSVGQIAHIYLDVKDTTNRFSLSKCECYVYIKLNNELIHTQEFTFSKSSNPQFDYVFPEVGSYTITLSGKPSDGKSFDPFSNSYEYVVTKRENANSWIANLFGTIHLVHYVGIGVIVIVFIGMVVKINLDKKTK